MNIPKVQNEKSSSATGHLFCTCNIPDIRRDDITPIVALIGEKTINNGYIAMFVYLRYYGAQFDSNTGLVTIYDTRSGDKYGSVPIQLFVDYLFDFNEGYDDYDTVRHAYEIIGDNYATKEILIHSDGTKVKINRSYRTFKPTDISYNSYRLEYPVLKDLDKWPLVFLLRCFTGMLTYFRGYCSDGHNINAARRLALMEYRKRKAIEEGNNAHKKKFIEEVLTTLNLDIDSGASPTIANTSRMGYTATGRVRTPRRERDREPARNEGGLFYDSQGNVREITRDIQGNLRIPTRGRSWEDAVGAHEHIIRNALNLDPDQTVGAQTRITISADTHGNEEFVISLMPADAPAEPRPVEQVIAEPVPGFDSAGVIPVPEEDRLPELGHNHYLGGTAHPNWEYMTISTHPGAPVNILHIQMHGRSYDRTVLEEKDAIKHTFQIPENESIFTTLNLDRVNEDRLTVSRRMFKRKLEVDGSYIVPLHDRSQIEILQSEGSFLREAFSVPLGLPLTAALELILDDERHELRITKKQDTSSRSGYPDNFRVRKEGRTMMATAIRLDSYLRERFNIPRSDSIFEHIYAEEDGDYFVFCKRQAVPLARAAGSSEPSENEDDARDEDDAHDEDEYYDDYDDDYDEDEEEER